MPRVARKYSLPIVILVISLVVVGAPTAATVSGFSDLHSHKHAQLHFRPQLDFGALSSESTTKTFANALVVGRGATGPVSFAFVNGATTWDRVFSGVSILVQTHGGESTRGDNDDMSGTDDGSGSNTGDEAPVSKACISLGMTTCPASLTAVFTPTASTTYDYMVTFTTVSTIPSGVTLQTTSSSS